MQQHEAGKKTMEKSMTFVKKSDGKKLLVKKMITEANIYFIRTQEMFAFCGKGRDAQALEGGLEGADHTAAEELEARRRGETKPPTGPLWSAAR